MILMVTDSGVWTRHYQKHNTVGFLIYLSLFVNCFIDSCDNLGKS